MKLSGIQAKMKKRFKITTKVNPKAKAAPNVLNRDFTAMKPNQRWVLISPMLLQQKVGFTLQQ